MNKQLKTHLIANHGYKADENGERLEKPKLVRCCNGFECGCEGRLGYKSEDEFYYNTAKTVVEIPTVEEFWDELCHLVLINELSYEQAFKLNNSYLVFIRQLLTLSMFVPVKDGKVLEEPESYQDYLRLEMISFCNLYTKKEELVKCQQYQTAQSNVLFEGWEVNIQGNNVKSISNDKLGITFFDTYNEIKAVEIGNVFHFDVKQISDLLPFGLTLKQ